MNNSIFAENLRKFRLAKNLRRSRSQPPFASPRRPFPVGSAEFPKLKDTTLKPPLTLLPNNTILEVHPMKMLISCEYNFDNCCVELKFTDGA